MIRTFTINITSLVEKAPEKYIFYLGIINEKIMQNKESKRLKIHFKE